MPNDTLTTDQNGNMLPLFVLGNSPEIVNGTAASAASAVIDATNFAIVQLYASADCNIHVAAAPTATTSTMAIPGKQLLYFRILPGDKIAVLGAILQITKHNG
jgi:hypothetical protein